MSESVPAADLVTSKVTENLSRVERKRRNTRERIVTEAESLMRTRAIDEITIQDITEAAGIGHGTFYLHFKSKYEVLIPIVERDAIRWDQVIQVQMRGIEDPAIVLASSARYMARVIAADPLWRWFLEHSGVPVDDMRHAIGGFGARDFGRGLVSGRFKVPEVSIASSFMMGGFVNGLLASFESSDPGNVIDQMMELFLRVVGLEAEEAKSIANLPLVRLN
jgi:AcrR family transcriptional regulator